MRKILGISLIIAGAYYLNACSYAEEFKNKPMELKTQKDTVSYSLGVNVAQSLKQQGFTEIDVEVMAKAMQDVYQENALKISAQEGNMALNNYMMQKQQEEAKKGKEFLEKNKKEPDVKTTASGLQYKVLEEGTGPKPTAEDRVKVHYTGKLLNGKVFDSSVERGQPAVFGVKQVIPGWTEALQLMPVGSKYRLFIPSELAYGERGAGQDIGPNEVLIFDVELLGIEGKE